MHGMNKTFLPLLAAALCLSSCIGEKDFTIRTLPEGANVSINGKKLEGKTPITTSISQEKDLGIVVDKPGYEVTTATVTTKTNWWLSLLWTEHDPRAQYIEADEITIPMKKIPTAAQYTPSTLPSWKGEKAASSSAATPPPLRPLPHF